MKRPIARRFGRTALSALALVLLVMGLNPAPAASKPVASLGPGQLFQAAGISLIIPPAGHGVWASALDITGAWHSLGIETAPDGSVSIIRSAPANPGGAMPDSPGACSDGAYTLYSNTWKIRDKWWFNSGTTPSEVQKPNATSALRAAASNITHADNNCGLSDKVSAKHKYQGTSTKSPNIGTSTCLGSDGKSVVAFGDLLSTYLALTCWWTSGGHTIEADMKLNSFDYLWVVNIGGACINKWSVESVATHEFGHAFGLGHVSEASHAHLTMSPVIMPCQSSEKSLGLGDVRGLEAQY
jgi:hypothetical protein